MESSRGGKGFRTKFSNRWQSWTGREGRQDKHAREVRKPSDAKEWDGGSEREGAAEDALAEVGRENGCRDR